MTCNQADDGDHDPPDAPLASEHKADEEEDEQNTAGKLEVHLAVLLLELRQAGKVDGLAHPRVRQDHDQATHDRQVAQEEVEIKNKTVAESLGDNHGDETANGIL
ncbi:hypothetical protein PoMZ_10336 [Pyricularia oryzae]|uniref:Uncharacterized protein n=1 Tax=Pyricularia oryzae TaxID=318829 RepID=A0A4P7N3X2_PYROR|nr:hypothetical protein PoMZ_10336 [Pyricularia oryzae]